MTTDTFQPIHPCFFMKTLLSAACDNALTGVSQWFTEWHVAHCHHCAAALAALRELHRRLSALVSPEPEAAEPQLSPERWARLEAAWAEADERT